MRVPGSCWFVVTLGLAFGAAGCDSGSGAPAANVARPSAAPAPRVAAQVAPAALNALNAQDRALCTLAATFDPDDERHKLASDLARNLVIDLDGDGRTERIEIGSMGTMHMDYVRLHRDGAREGSADPPASFEETDEERGWNYGRAVLAYAGAAYLVEFRGNAPRYLDRIGRILPDGSLLPVCRFAPQPRRSFVGAGAAPGRAANEAPALCEAASAGRVRALAERRYSEARVVETGAHARHHSGELDVDFDNDGRPERLLRTGLDSSAGRGCHQEGYALPPGAPAAARALLERLQDRAPDRGSCYDGTVRWLRHAGRSYLEIASRSSAEPRQEGEEYHFIATVENGRARRVCEARYALDRPRLIAWGGTTGWTAVR